MRYSINNPLEDSTKTYYIPNSLDLCVKLDSKITGHKKVPHGGIFSIKNPDSKILDFSSNTSPIGPPPLVQKTIKKQLSTLEIYPDPESTQLRRNLQWYTKIPYGQIVVGNGATEIIYNFCQAFLPNSEILIPIPTFGEYEAAAKLAGAKVSFFKTMNLENDLDDFISKIPKNGCVFICNPNNPTGNILSKKQLSRLILAAKKKHSLVFVDECFIELVPNSNESVSSLVKKFENLFVLRSLTKSFGLAGIRIGYGLSNKKMIDILNKIKIPWNVSGMAQQAAGAALCHSFYLEKTKKLIQKESQFLRKEISKLKGFECHETQTNFILIKTKSKSQTLQSKLLKKNILIRDCSTFRGLNDHYIRIAVKKRPENLKLVKALASIS